MALSLHNPVSPIDAKNSIPFLVQFFFSPLDVKAKDKILFGKWSGNEVMIDGEELLIMKESDILGIIG